MYAEPSSPTCCRNESPARPAVYHGRDPITWNHVIEKESLNLKELEHVRIEKVETFSGHALGSLAISGNLAEVTTAPGRPLVATAIAFCCL
jgi:hypothetical protein